MDENKDTSEPKPTGKWYTTKEASEYLGISQPTIFRWMKDGTLSFYKVGGATRFSQEGLDAVIEKTTGAKEAAQAAGRCTSCGHNLLVEGNIRGAGKLYFKPQKSAFWVWHEAMVEAKARACSACGHIQFYVETDRLKKLRPDQTRTDSDDSDDK